MNRIIKFVGLSVLVMVLSACRAGEDAIVVEHMPNGDNKCWVLIDQQITHADDGLVRWHSPNDTAVHVIKGTLEIVRSGGHNQFKDIWGVLDTMGITDPKKCTLIDNTILGGP